MMFFVLFFFDHLQESLELCLHLYPSLYLLLYTAFSLALWVCHTKSSQVRFRFHSSVLVLMLTCSFICLSASVGISFLQFTNLNSMRNLIIIGLTLFLGISVPQLFNQYWTPARHGLVHTNAGWVSFL